MKKLLTSIAATVMAACTAFFAASCTEGVTTKSAIDDGTLTIGYTIYAPMNYFEEGTNEFVGFDTELAEAFCQELGVEAQFVEITWGEKFNELSSGTIDVIWNGMTITDEVKEKTAVSNPYLENKQVVVCKADNASKFTDVASVKTAASVAFEAGSAGQSAAEQAEVENTVAASAQRDALMEVAAGTSEIAIVDITMAQVLTGEGTSYADLTFVDVGFDVEQFGVSFRKSDAVLAKTFDVFVKLCKENGVYEGLMAKYFA